MHAMMHLENAMVQKLSLGVMQTPECPVCWDDLNDNIRTPRVLRCGHTFCESCLQHLPLDTKLGQQCLICPECRSPSLWKGLTELPKNFILLSAIDQTLQACVNSMDEARVSDIVVDPSVLLSFLHSISRETKWVQGKVKRKFWQATRLFSLVALLLLLMPLSLAHMLLAWWAAVLGFFSLIWFVVGGLGFGVFMFCIWAMYNALHIFLWSDGSDKKPGDAQ